MRTHQYAHKKRASQSLRTSVPRPSEIQSSVQPPQIQAKSNEEGLAEHVERLKKFQRLGNSMMQMGPPRLDNNTTSSVKPKPWIQRKLTIGEPGDKYEQEADRVASQVVQTINAPTTKENNIRESIQREKDLEGVMYARGFQAAIQRKQAIADGEASSDLDSAINSARSGGQPLDTGLQQSMGQAMGADFSGVKVHTDTQSDQLNQSIQARAFTTGQDVFFRDGAYQPGNRGGQELIAHELTHVVQQNGGVVQWQGNHKIDGLLQGQFATHSLTPQFQTNSVLCEERAESTETDARRNTESETEFLMVRGSTDVGIIQRFPKKDEQAGDYFDTEYPMVRMTEVNGEGYLSKTYKITSAGQHKDRIVRFEGDKYYPLNEQKDCVYDNPVHLYEHSKDTLNAAKQLTNIGQPGIGVLAGNVGDVFLDTSGMNDCVGWLIYNREAAYLEHILVSLGTGVDIGKMATAMAEVVRRFKEETEELPEGVVIKFDSTKYDPDKLPEWILALIPKGIKVTLDNTGGALEYKVMRGDKERKIWRCAPILYETQKMRDCAELERQIEEFETEKKDGCEATMLEELGEAKYAMGDILIDYNDGKYDLENAKARISRIKNRYELIELIIVQTNSDTHGDYGWQILDDFDKEVCTYEQAKDALIDLIANGIE